MPLQSQATPPLSLLNFHPQCFFFANHFSGSVTFKFLCRVIRNHDSLNWYFYFVLFEFRPGPAVLASDFLLLLNAHN